jgi:hypothetical protein
MIPSTEELKLIDKVKLPLTHGSMIKEIGILPTYVLDDLYRVYDSIKHSPSDQTYETGEAASTISLNNKDSLVTRWLNVDKKISFDSYIHFSRFSDISRMIISKTTPHTIIDWHVLHENPRMHIQLFGRDCYFDVLDSDKKLHSKKLETGKLYAVNVCYPHRVRCMGDVERIQLFYDYTKPLF